MLDMNMLYRKIHTPWDEQNITTVKAVCFAPTRTMDIPMKTQPAAEKLNDPNPPLTWNTANTQLPARSRRQRRTLNHTKLREGEGESEVRGGGGDTVRLSEGRGEERGERRERGGKNMSGREGRRKKRGKGEKREEKKEEGKE
jgi:hypothetical protein